MTKFALLLVAFACLTLSNAYGQIQISDSVRKSKELADVRLCIRTMLENAKKQNLATDRDNTITVVEHPTREPLIPHATEVFECLAKALPKKTTYTQKNSKLLHDVWYAEVDGFVIFCGTLASPHSKDYVTTVGGQGPRRAWYSIYIPCRIGKEISLN